MLKTKTNSRPLFRWTMGSVFWLGYETLLESIKLAKLHWGDEVDYIVVCNNIPNHLGNDLTLRGIDWIYADTTALPFPARGFGWKYYPPRLRPDGHELFIDNDLIFLKRSKYVDKFLSGDYTLYNEDIGRGFAEYESLIGKEMNWYKFGANGGLFGFPPRYDVKTKLLNVCGGWPHHLSEQGLTAYLTLSYPNRVGIPMPVVYNDNFGSRALGTYQELYPNSPFLDAHLMSQLEGYHFIGANRGPHPAWKLYKHPKPIPKILL